MRLRISALVYPGPLADHGLSAGTLGEPAVKHGPFRTDFTTFELEVVGGVAGPWHATIAPSAVLEPRRLRVPWRTVASGSGEYHMCVSSEQGDVSCWGTSEFGQLGDLTAALSAPHLLAGLEDVVEVSLGTRHTCVRTTDGRVSCFGDNQWKQLGRPGFEGITDPRPVEVPGIAGTIQLDATGNHTCALDRDGVVVCWGSFDQAPVVAGPVAFPVAIEEIAVGGFSVCGLAGGDVYCAGRVGPTGGGSACEADNLHGPVRVDLPGRATAVEQGDAFACARLESGELHCWGCNSEGQIGLETYTPHEAHRPVLPNVRTFELGRAFGCAVLEDDKTVCWGDNAFGQLGAALIDPGAHRAIAVMDLGPVRDLAVHWSHACALLESGEVACWGDGRQGQLGNAISGNASVPRIVHFQ